MASTSTSHLPITETKQLELTESDPSKKKPRSKNDPVNCPVPDCKSSQLKDIRSHMFRSHKDIHLAERQLLLSTVIPSTTKTSKKQTRVEESLRSVLDDLAMSDDSIDNMVVGEVVDDKRGKVSKKTGCQKRSSSEDARPNKKSKVGDKPTPREETGKQRVNRHEKKPKTKAQPVNPQPVNKKSDNGKSTTQEALHKDSMLPKFKTAGSTKLPPSKPSLEKEHIALPTQTKLPPSKPSFEKQHIALPTQSKLPSSKPSLEKQHIAQPTQSKLPSSKPSLEKQHIALPTQTKLPSFNPSLETQHVALPTQTKLPSSTPILRALAMSIKKGPSKQSSHTPTKQPTNKEKEMALPAPSHQVSQTQTKQLSQKQEEHSQQTTLPSSSLKPSTDEDMDTESEYSYKGDPLSGSESDFDESDSDSEESDQYEDEEDEPRCDAVDKMDGSPYAHNASRQETMDTGEESVKTLENQEGKTSMPFSKAEETKIVSMEKGENDHKCNASPSMHRPSTITRVESVPKQDLTMAKCGVDKAREFVLEQMDKFTSSKTIIGGILDTPIVEKYVFDIAKLLGSAMDCSSYETLYKVGAKISETISIVLGISEVDESLVKPVLVLLSQTLRHMRWFIRQRVFKDIGIKSKRSHCGMREEEELLFGKNFIEYLHSDRFVGPAGVSLQGENREMIMIRVNEIFTKWQESTSPKTNSYHFKPKAALWKDTLSRWVREGAPKQLIAEASIWAGRHVFSVEKRKNGKLQHEIKGIAIPLTECLNGLGTLFKMWQTENTELQGNIKHCINNIVTACLLLELYSDGAVRFEM